MNKQLNTTQLPNLLEIQRASFCWFLAKGLAEELANTASIVDLTEDLELKLYVNEYKLKQPILTIVKSKERNTSYCIRLYTPIELIHHSASKSKNTDTTEIINDDPVTSTIFEKQTVFMGEIPLMTEKGTFIINGCERIIVNQIVRSPGVYYKRELKKNQMQSIYSATIITRRGSWITFILENNLIWVNIDKKYKIPINWFLAAVNLSNKEIYETIKNSDFLQQSIAEIKEKNEMADARSEKFAILKVKDLITTRILNPKYYDLGEVGRVKINNKLGLNLPLQTRIITAQDILIILDFLIDIQLQNKTTDDIDSLINRRVRCVGELLQTQIRVGLNRLERSISEKLTTYDITSLQPNIIINPKPLIATIKEFFGSSQLSQFLDETNPLAELTHKRRISALGPGGLSTDHVTFAARDIHPTQYGRLCPIETPEGQNAGLIASLASYAKLDRYGFIQTPFYLVKNGQIIVNADPIFLTAEQEKEYKIVTADVKKTNDGYLKGSLIPVRYQQEFQLVSAKEVELAAISPIQIISPAAALIPFLEHDDANRALMGSNMQRQAVPLLYTQMPLVGTGLESSIVVDSANCLISYTDGLVERVSANEIVIKTIASSNQVFYKEYSLLKYKRSNQDTCINQKPIVWLGQNIKSGQVIADNSATKNGRLALGQNLTAAYMPWEGYNFEDAILVSERLIFENLFTSIHIEKYEIEIRQTKNGEELMTPNIPNTNETITKRLQENGVIRVGSLVKEGDILVGKTTPKVDSDQLPEGKLLKAIFGEKTPSIKDSSLRVPKGITGRVIETMIFSKDQGDNLPTGTIHLVRVFVAQIRKITVGDKISGRHGNKGIISRILPIQDMPFLPDGQPVDIIFNPLGVPSRMNVGQIFECLLGLAGDQLNKRFQILPFDEMYNKEASRILINTKLQEAAKKKNKPWLFNSSFGGKIVLKDGRTGENFDNPVLVGKTYVLKLVHLVDDKIHARSTGPYSLVTQQPVGGKAQHGGQRFGEMEVWALEAFGAAYTLQELLTLKSDDMLGRNEVLNAIVKGKPIPKPGIPESFKVLLRELQALGLDITTYRFENHSSNIKSVEINLMESE